MRVCAFYGGQDQVRIRASRPFRIGFCRDPRIRESAVIFQVNSSVQTLTLLQQPEVK